MTKPLIVIFLTNLFAFGAFAQQDSLQVNKVTRDTLNYRSYTRSGNTLFAINEKGKLRIWDLSKPDTIAFNGNKRSINYTAATKDVHNKIFISSADGSVFKLATGNYSPSLYLKIKHPIQSLVFNSQNKLFLITSDGVYDVETRRYWDNFTIHAQGLITIKKKKLQEGSFTVPQHIFLDKQDRLWMSASYGEFGTDMQVFDTGKKEILDSLAKKARNNVSNPNSFFNDDRGNLYITSGLQHFMNWGNIVKVDKDDIVTEVFDGKIKGTEKRMFIGPGAYNAVDSSIHFATTDGFYRAMVNNGNFEPGFLFKPRLSWSREPMAIGVAMTIRQVSFTDDNMLLFLTTNNGFGIYDGKKLTLFK